MYLIGWVEDFRERGKLVKYVSESEFLKRNDLVANAMVYKVLKYCTLGGPLIALGTYFNIFETAYSDCLLIWVVALGAYGILHYFSKSKENYNKAKYFGLFAVEIMIGIMATEQSIGIHITYGLVPLLSCVYIDEKLTRRVALFSYLMMIISLYFRSFGITTFDYPRFTPMEWFISQSMGFTVEYAIFSIATYSVTMFLKGVLIHCYQIGKENSYFEEAGKVKNAFLANLSEELRLPLDEVSKVSEVLLEQDTIAPEIKERLAHIAKSNEVMYTFIDDMQDFSKLQLDKIEIVAKKYCLRELVQSIYETIKSRIGDKNIDLNLVVDPSIPDELYGDPLRIRQILIHLLSNTVKYMEDGFIILRINWMRSGQTAILNIEVMDTGCGINEEMINQLFESFCKLEAGEKATMEGVGLGLPICKRLCEMMGGTVAVSEGYGHSSLFTVTLPQKIISEREK